MVTAPHEALHRIFQEDPTLIARSLNRLLGIAFPKPKEVAVINVDLTEIAPIERRADTVLMVETGSGKHVVVIESQTAPEDSRRFAWPYYVAFLNNRYKCPVTLLVVTADVATADWASRPIKIGLAESPSQVTKPLVLGPEDVPVIRTVGLAKEDVMLAVLSALTHRHNDFVDEILETLNEALGQIDKETAAHLAEITEVGLGKTPAAEMWRALMSTMTYGFQSELHRKWRAEGREEGRAQEAAADVLHVLATRSLAVPDEVAERVKSCTDLAVLKGLLTRAVTVERAEDLFSDQPG